MSHTLTSEVITESKNGACVIFQAISFFLDDRHIAGGLIESGLKTASEAAAQRMQNVATTIYAASAIKSHQSIENTEVYTDATLQKDLPRPSCLPRDMATSIHFAQTLARTFVFGLIRDLSAAGIEFESMHDALIYPASFDQLALDATAGELSSEDLLATSDEAIDKITVSGQEMREMIVYAERECSAVKSFIGITSKIARNTQNPFYEFCRLNPLIEGKFTHRDRAAKYKYLHPEETRDVDELWKASKNAQLSLKKNP